MNHRPLLPVLATLLLAASVRASSEDWLKIFASDLTASTDNYGWSLAIDGEKAVVGNFVMDGAYLHDVSDGTELFRFVTSLTFDSQFGSAVALDGSFVAVGAPKDDESNPNAGAVYLFDTTTGALIFKLRDSHGNFNDNLGYSVAVDGNYVLAGSQSTVGQFNSAFLFDATLGKEIWELWPDEPSSEQVGLRFGWSVAIGGSTLVVGAPQRNIGNGAVYLFDALTGLQTAKLTASDGAFMDIFGTDVDVHGRTLVVGASNDDDNGSDSGSVYVFDLTTGLQVAKLLPEDGAADDRFGQSVAVHGDFALIGAPYDDDNGPDSGSAYLFDLITGTQLAKLVEPGGDLQHYFGWTVDLSDSHMLVAATGGHGLEAGTGCAYLFELADKVGAPFCDGSDGALAACPCSNPGAPGTGCDLQQGTGGVDLRIVRQEAAPQNGITWLGSGFPATGTPTSIVIRSTGLDPSSPVVFGDGLRCVGVPLVRLASAFAIAGQATHTHGHGAGAGTFYYQLWFRNTPAMFCTPDAFNLSSGRSIAW